MIPNHGEPPTKSRGLAEVAWTLLGLSLIARTVAFGSQLIVSALYGTSEAADLFYYAQNLVTSTEAIVVTVIATLAITSLVEIRERENALAAGHAVENLLSYSGLILVAIATVIFVGADVIVLRFSAFSSEAAPRAVRALRVVAVCGTLTALGQILTAVHNARRSFVMPAALGVLQTALFVAVILIARRLLEPVSALAVATGISAAISLAVLLRAFKGSARLSWRFVVAPNHLRIARIQGLPLLASQAMASVWMITGRGVVAGLTTGSLSALTYAERLRGLFLEFLVMPLAPMALTRYSESLARGDAADAWDSLQRVVAAVWFVIVPATAMVWFVGDWFIILVFQRGAFTSWSSDTTYAALRLYVLGLWAEAAHYFVCRFFIASNRVTALTVLGIAPTLLYVLGATYLPPHLGVPGIALSYAMMCISAHLLTTVWLCHRAKLRPSKWLLRVVAKIAAVTAASSGTMMLVRWLIATPLNPSGGRLVLSLVVVAGSGALAYLGGAVILSLHQDVGWLWTSLTGLMQRWRSRLAVTPPVSVEPETL